MINLDFADHRPLYEQIKEKIKILIISGAMEENQKIPSVRELAQNLAINPNTIQHAYKDLETEGYINSVRGKGNFVAPLTEVVNTKRYEELIVELKNIIKEMRFLGVKQEKIHDTISGIYSGEEEIYD